MKQYPLNSQGFIMQYLISGLKEEPMADHTADPNQLHYEKYLRSIVTEPQGERPAGEIVLGRDSSLGLPWRYYYNYGNWFVDLSTFYSVLTRVELDACTQLAAEEDMNVEAAVWSYSSVDLWCGREHVCRMTPPVYKPIRRQKTVLNLKKGLNSLYIRLQTLGVRDTRTLFGIQILEKREKISVALPDSRHTDPAAACADWLSGAVLRDGILRFPAPAPAGTRLGYDSETPDFGKRETGVEYLRIDGCSEVKLKAGRSCILLECVSEGEKLIRRMENLAAVVPQRMAGLSFEDNLTVIFRRIAAVESLSRGGKFGFSISNILARKAVGMEAPEDRRLFWETLSQIERRFDCSDFLVCGLVRYLKNYELGEEQKERVKQVLLGYRYWMDQEGSDAMCFWSENHALMFYVSAMNAGEMYPDEYFVRARMSGRQLYEAGKRRLEQWLSDVETHGFEEFLSTVYMCVTFAGLLNAVDYSPEELSARAAGITDRLLEMLALHTYKGSVIAPMGRVYRQIIYPFRQGAQALMNLVNPEVPYSYGEGWLAFFATSRYRIPERLKEKMEQAVSAEYSTGNALIRLEKNESYCLTSVQSPRQDPGFHRWVNLTLKEETEDVEKNSHEYTKSLNERFHGTTCFEPGVYGYQQHMWSAALDSETQVFVNHPGSPCDSGGMRPGFWYGNGVMPAVRQEKGKLGAVYVISEEHPIHFTHVFWPDVKFDRTRKDGHWLFGEKDRGYLALWCSQTLEAHQDQLFDCEYRSYGDEIAYFCVCGRKEDYGSLEAFAAECGKENPAYDRKTRSLTAGELKVTYEGREDRTQYI